MLFELLLTAQHSPRTAWSGRNWASALFRFLALMHGFRLATEPGTRASGAGLGTGYTGSVGNLHGWADGDPFYVNYVGHPMQGTVSGRLWLLHDRRHRRPKFGNSADAWKRKPVPA